MGNMLEMWWHPDSFNGEENKALDTWKGTLPSEEDKVKMKKLLQKKLEQVFNNLSTPTRLNLVPAKLTHLVELGVSIDDACSSDIRTSSNSCLDWCLYNSDLRHHPTLFVEAFNILVKGGLHTFPKDTMGELTKIALGDGINGAKSVIAMGLSLKGIDINAETIVIEDFTENTKVVYAPIYYAEMLSLETINTSSVIAQENHDNTIAVRKEVFEMLKNDVRAEYVTPEQKKHESKLEEEQLTLDLKGRLYHDSDDDDCMYHREITNVECFDDGQKMVNDVDGGSNDLDYVQSHLIPKD